VKLCPYVCLHPRYHSAILQLLLPLHSSVGGLDFFVSEQGRLGVGLGGHRLAGWRLPRSLGHHAQVVRSVVGPFREMSGKWAHLAVVGWALMHNKVYKCVHVSLDLGVSKCTACVLVTDDLEVSANRQHKRNEHSL